MRFKFCEAVLNQPYKIDQLLAGFTCVAISERRQTTNNCLGMASGGIVSQCLEAKRVEKSSKRGEAGGLAYRGTCPFLLQCDWLRGFSAWRGDERAAAGGMLLPW